MSCGGRALLKVCLALPLLALPASALTVTVESTGATQVVSGIATISASGVGAGNYVVLRAGGKFLAAVADPFTFEWDTRGLEDGSLALEAVETGADGPVGTPYKTNVLVTNSATVPTPVTLKWGVKAGDVLKTTIAGECDVYDGVREDLRHKFVPARLYRVLAGTVTGAAVDTVGTVANGSIAVDRSLDKLTVDSPGQITELAGSGHKTAFSLLPTGRIEDAKEAGVLQARAGMLWISLPTAAVEVRGQWTGDMVCLESAQTGSVRYIKDATYELLGFRMWEGQKCALVEGRARYSDDLAVKLTGDEERFPRVSTIVRRLSYFSLDTGRVLRAEETVERWLPLKTDDWGVGPESFVDETDATKPATGGTTGTRPMGAGTGMAPGSPMMGGMAGRTTGATEPADKVPANVDLVYSIQTTVTLTK
jgi:hypothetical protein